jgi:iron complex transport system substrate-binding protein
MSTKNTIILTDQLANSVSLPIAAQRIVSLVPSITETLCQMGLQNRVVGITKFCVHPTALKKIVPIIGGTKNINFEKIKALKPDLIIASKEENNKEQIETLSHFCPIYVSDIIDYETCLQALNDIAILNNVNLQKLNWYPALEAFNNYAPSTLNNKCLYLIWRKPYMTIGGDTYINFMLKKAGFINVFEKEKRYPTVETSFFDNNKVDFIFLSSEPFPFKDKHIAALQILAPNAKIILVDGEIFSWYGYRTTKALSYFATLQQMLL